LAGIGQLMSRPYNGLCKNDILTIKCGRRRSIELVTKREGFSNTVAEHCIIWAGEHTVSGQVVWWLCHALTSMANVAP